MIRNKGDVIEMIIYQLLLDGQVAFLRQEHGSLNLEKCSASPFVVVVRKHVTCR